MDLTLTVLLASTLAAATAYLGALPLAWRDQVQTARIGWANATAAGLMLGAAYALTEAHAEVGASASALGAVAGIGFTFWTHRVSGTSDLDLNRLQETDPVYGYKLLILRSLHSASEGVAIGVAMLVNVPFGIFMAVAIAIHNIPEATVLTAILRSQGVRFGEAAGLAVGTNVTQVLMSVATYAVVRAAPSTLDGVLGYAAGALIYLVLVELLPEAYREAGPTSIALVTSLAIGMVVLLHGLLG